MYDFIKRFVSDDTFFYGALLLCIGISSFGLGRWSVADVTLTKQPATIMYSEVKREASVAAGEDAVASSPASTAPAPGQFVGSKNGSKYHLPWCPGAQQMKEENKLWFSSKEAAEAAGYAPASNCKGI